jgi:transcriptional regulator with XRE-family HTH domain
VKIVTDKNIGRRIQRCREQKGYTQEKFAEMLGLTPNYISAVERGVKTPRLEKLIAIINGLGVSTDEIFMDVIDVGYKIKVSKLTDDIFLLPPEEQSRIFAVIETMINEAKRQNINYMK